ncbi:Glycosyltransferase Gtf1 [compost metagenome]
MNCESNDGIFRIVSCSRLEDVKRVDKIVEILSIVEQHNVDIEWTHIGGGKNFNKIKKLSNKKIKKVNVELLGNISNAEVIKFYKENSVDLFINVSSSEGLPVSIMEAISFGIPCIATDVGGTAEIIIDGESGNLISNDFKIEDVANLIISIIKYNKENKYLCLREKTRLIWEQNFQAKYNYDLLCERIKMNL